MNDIMEKKVLNLNGCVLKNTKDIWDDGAGSVWSLISVRKDGYLTVKGNGSVVAKENDCYAVDVRDGGHLIIENGFFNGNITAIYVHDGVAEIKGGEFDVQQLNPGPNDKRFLLNCLDKNYKNGTAKIVVSGGRFHGFDPGNNLAEGPETNFLAPGYKTVEVETDVFEVVAE